MIGNNNNNVLSKYIALYSQSPSNFCFVLLGKMTSNLVMIIKPIRTKVSLIMKSWELMNIATQMSTIHKREVFNNQQIK